MFSLVQSACVFLWFCSWECVLGGEKTPPIFLHTLLCSNLAQELLLMLCWGREAPQRGVKALERFGAVSGVIPHWHPSSEPKRLGGLREARALLLLILHMVFIFCKFHVGNFFCLRAVEGSFLQDQIFKVILTLLCLWVFAVYIPGTNPWWIEADHVLYPGHSSLFRWPFWLQCVIPACLRIVFLCERLEDWIPGLSICISWLEAKLSLASKCVENLFLLFCQCKVLGKDFYLEYPFNSN